MLRSGFGQKQKLRMTRKRRKKKKKKKKMMKRKNWRFDI